MPIKVAIVEDNEKLRATLGRVIGRTEGFQCVGLYATGEEALAAIPGLRPDVVLMDINLPGLTGVECVRQLKPQCSETQFIMLTVYEDTDNIFNALAAGATGYLLKRSSREELLQAIRDVVSGGSPMTTHIARKVVQSFQRPTPRPPDTTAELSPREREVLDLLAQGFLYKEIADRLGVSYETVHTHIRRIYEKLQVRTRTEAVAKFLKR
ncbi:MAG: response regulator transcription factor [Limisphaera sp.]